MRPSQTWSTVILTRRDVTFAFSNPRAPNPVPAIQGFRTVGLDPCNVLFANHTVAGCLGEDIHILNAQ